MIYNGKNGYSVHGLVVYSQSEGYGSKWLIWLVFGGTPVINNVDDPYFDSMMACVR
jgi:hypothetical protein